MPDYLHEWSVDAPEISYKLWLERKLAEAQAKYDLEHEAYMDLFRQLSEYERRELALPHHLKPQEGEAFEHWCKNTGKINQIALQAYLYNILTAKPAENGGASRWTPI